MNEEVLNPVKITLSTGDVYELDFCKDSVRFAESRQFKTEDVFSYPDTKISELFFYAFRKNHRKVSKETTDKILAKMGGLTEKTVMRLIALYDRACYSNRFQSEEDLEKNSEVTVEL